MSTQSRAAPVLALGAFLIAATLAAGAGYALGHQPDGPDQFRTAMAVVGAIGATILALATRPAWPLSIGLALAVFSSHWSDMDIPLPVDRLLIAAAIGSILLRELAAGRAVRTRPIHWLLAVTLLYALCSSIVVGTLDVRDSRFVLIDRFGLVPFTLFFVAPLAYRTREDREILLGVLVALGAYLGVTALIEAVDDAKGLAFPSYISDPNVGIHFDRARGPFVESSAMGFALFACAVASAIAVVTRKSPRTRGFAALVLLLCLLGTLFTLTRAVWLGTAIGAVVALAWPRQTRRALVPAVALGALLVVGAFAVVPGLQARATKRSNDDGPLWDRRNSNAAALRMFEERPLLGHGWGSFRTDSTSYYRQADDYPLTFVLDVHNVFLANAAELGALGSGLWLAALLWAIAGGMALGRTSRGPPDLRLWRYGLVGLAGCYLVVASSTPTAFVLPTYLLWTWAGLCWPQAEPSTAGE